MDNRYYFENSKSLKLGDRVCLDKTETSHLFKVRRAKIGDVVTGFCGDGLDYSLQIEEISKATSCKIIEIKKNIAKDVTEVTVFLATLKNDALNEAIDNLTQLNVKNIVLFDSKFSVAHVDKDKIEKLYVRAIQACKQSERADIVCIRDIKFSAVLEELKHYDLALFAYENSRFNFSADLQKFKNKKVALVIGCEGGFDKTEVESLSKVCKQISLGKTILRAPVACTALTAAVMAGLGEWN